MGRKPTVNQNLPPRMRLRRRGEKIHYYYDLGGKPRKEQSLGSDYVLALKQYAEFEIDTRHPANAHVTFRWVAEKYLVAELHKKAPRTQKDNPVFVLRLETSSPQGHRHSIEPTSFDQVQQLRLQHTTGDTLSRSTCKCSPLFRGKDQLVTHTDGGIPRAGGDLLSGKTIANRHRNATGCCAPCSDRNCRISLQG